MEQIKIISGNTEDELWQQVVADFAKDDELLEYNVVLKQGAKDVSLDIDIDPGGGFESGYEFTRLGVEIQKKNDFRFSIHHEGFVDKMGKLLGTEDVLTGYPEFDKKLVVKTNDTEKVKAAFVNDNVRAIFQSLTDFTLHIAHHHIKNEDGKEAFLELEIQRGVTDLAELKKIYHAFFEVLTLVDSE